MNLSSRLKILSVLFPLCAANCETKILNEELIYRTDDDGTFVRFAYAGADLKNTDNYSYDDPNLDFYKVNHQNTWRPIAEIISFDSFDYLQNTKIYKQNEIMQKYRPSRSFRTPNYLADKKYIYLQVRNGNQPEFYVLGDIDKFAYLGGSFVKFDDTVYCWGKPMDSVDLSSFQIVLYDSVANKYPILVAFDNDNFYLDCDPASQELLIEWNISEVDFREKYEN